MHACHAAAAPRSRAAAASLAWLGAGVAANQLSMHPPTAASPTPWQLNMTTLSIPTPTPYMHTYLCLSPNNFLEWTGPSMILDPSPFHCRVNVSSPQSCSVPKATVHLAVLCSLSIGHYTMGRSRAKRTETKVSRQGMHAPVRCCAHDTLWRHLEGCTNWAPGSGGGSLMVHK